MSALDTATVDGVCRMGQGAECCRYLTLSTGGFQCAKLGPLRAAIDARVAQELMNAVGDNCDGVPE